MAPNTLGEAGKVAGKVQKSISYTDKKRKIKRKESYAIYIYKVLKQVHPDTFCVGALLEIQFLLRQGTSWRLRCFSSIEVNRVPD